MPVGSLAARLTAPASSRSGSGSRQGRGRQQRLEPAACHRCLQRQLVSAAPPPLLHAGAGGGRRLGSAAALRSAEATQQGADEPRKEASEQQGAQPPADGAEEQQEDSVGVRAALAALRFYKGAISPLLPAACRYLPTCSVYSMEAYKRFGVAKGTALTAWRLLRCAPWGGRGYDPPRWPPPGLEPLFGGAAGGGGADGGGGGSSA